MSKETYLIFDGRVLPRVKPLDFTTSHIAYQSHIMFSSQNPVLPTPENTIIHIRYENML